MGIYVVQTEQKFCLAGNRFYSLEPKDVIINPAITFAVGFILFYFSETVLPYNPTCLGTLGNCPASHSSTGITGLNYHSQQVLEKEYYSCLWKSSVALWHDYFYP